MVGGSVLHEERMQRKIVSEKWRAVVRRENMERDLGRALELVWGT